MKYYGTLGPSCNDAIILEKMIQKGMTGIRLNLSHQSLIHSKEWIQELEKAQEKAGKSIDFMIDFMGPELRIGALEKEIHMLEGDIITLGDGTIPIPKEVIKVLNVGQEVQIDDGKLLLKVVDDTKENKIKCKVIRGGLLTSRKSIALPGCKISNPTLTKQDLENIAVAKQFHVTQVMLPFVRGKEDLVTLRKELDQAGCEAVEIFAKIENLDGVEHLEELIPYCDTIVIARGDLGNAIPLPKLPGIQQKIARICKMHHRKFMVVTQMLNSMIEAPVPTRAEVSDIFLAVLQGADSIMLTGETASGNYPVEAMNVMVETGEASMDSLKNEKM